MRHSPGPDLAVGSTSRPEKGHLRKRWKNKVQNHKQLIIPSGNRGKGVSITVFPLKFQLGLYCNLHSSMSDFGLCVFLQSFRALWAWGELVYKGVFFQGSLFRAKRWYQQLLLVLPLQVKTGGCCASKSFLLCSS